MNDHDCGYEGFDPGNDCCPECAGYSCAVCDDRAREERELEERVRAEYYPNRKEVRRMIRILENKVNGFGGGITLADEIDYHRTVYCKR